jgi:ribonuclease E
MKLRNIGGVIVVDFIDMESRRDQFQLLEHFTSAIKDDSARPQIAQLTELGLVELTRKRQGQNIYELFGKKCSTCSGIGHIENNLNFEEKSNKSTSSRTLDLDTSQTTDKEDKIIDKESVNPKNLNKEDSSISKDIETDNNNKLNTKEKNMITIDLTNDEKIVFSELGINPLIKLGKEYLTSNNFVRLKDNSIEKEKTIDHKKTKAKQISKSKEAEKQEISIEANPNSKNKSTKNINEAEEVFLLDKQSENELSDELNNSRKTRRRSSANIE